MSDRKTRYQISDDAAWITLDNPEKRNALSDALVRDLETDIDRALAEPKARCIVLSGEGSAFCAGADLSETKGAVPAGGPSPFVRVLQKLLASPKPVIAAVNGAAFAGGLGLVAAADIAIAADHVKFSFSEVKIGVIPAVISVVCVPKLGAHQARRLFLTGVALTAQEAVDAGLVHRAVPADGLREAVLADVRAIALGAPAAVAESKALIARIAGSPSPQLFAWAERKSAEMFLSADAAEGMAAFREKRPPCWAAG